MHIAIVRTEFIRKRGGAERYAVELAQHWLMQGHWISVVCTKHDPEDAAGMTVVRVTRPKVLGPFKHHWFAKRAGAAAAETGADAVLCLARAYPGDVLRLGDGLHHMWLEVRYGNSGARKRARLNPRHRELLKLERELLRKNHFKLFVANSEMIRDELIQRFEVDAARIEVIPNGVDWGRFNTGVRIRREELRTQYRIPADARLVLFSGMDFRRKGLAEATAGFIELARREPRVWFACVGPGYVERARVAMTEAGVVDRCRFVGHTDNVAAWYGCADVFVLPTMHDPSANAVTEALACGTPVITSRENGARQHVRDGVNGWVLQDRTNAAELAQRIEQVLNAPPHPEAVTDSAMLVSREVNADRMLDALKRAAGLTSQ
jgi:UDP-glucose:(heptosyl)LPS alpha-1,3-glucosyltransferase